MKIELIKNSIRQFSVKQTNHFLTSGVLIGFIYLILEMYYHFFISDYFAYMGFINDFKLVKYLITKIVFAGLLLLGYRIYLKNHFLFSIFLCLILLFYIPNSILYAFSNKSNAPFLSNVFFVSTFSLSAYINFSIPKITISDKNRNWIMYFFTILLFLPIILVFKNQINLKTLFLGEVYETRDLFSDKISGLLNYDYNILVKTVLPVTLIYFMIKKNKLSIILFTLGLIYLYVISGNKIVYFTTFILIFFYYIGSEYLSKTLNFLLLLLIFLVTIPVVDLLFFDEPILRGTFVNRFLFIPALLTDWYFEFFNGKPFYFAESHFFNHFVKSPYEMPVGYLITKVYWNEPTVYANNGIVSDGFMNLGYAGVLLFSILFSILFSVFNSLKLNPGYFGLFFSYIYVFLSAPFLSCFITGGVLLFLLLAVFVLREKEQH